MSIRPWGVSSFNLAKRVAALIDDSLFAHALHALLLGKLLFLARTFFFISANAVFHDVTTKPRIGLATAGKDHSAEITEEQPSQSLLEVEQEATLLLVDACRLLQHDCALRRGCSPRSNASSVGRRLGLGLEG